MRSLLRSVVTEGTAKNAAVAGYAIGGKTGTSEKIDVFDENGRRVLDKIVSFVGIAPMDDPQYLVLAALDTPSRDCGTYLSGGAMAAPTVGAILGDLLPYLNVKKEAGAEQWVPLKDYRGLTKNEALKQAKDQKILIKTAGTEEKATAQIPLPGQNVPEGSEILLYFGEEPESSSVEMPDFRGMNRQQAGELAMSLGLYLEPRGNPDPASNVKVVSQSLGPGNIVPRGTNVILEFTDATVRD